MKGRRRSYLGRRFAILLKLSLGELKWKSGRSMALLVSMTVLTTLLVFLGGIENGAEIAVRSGLEGIGADLLVTSDVVDPMMQLLKLAMYQQEAIFITPPRRVHLNVSPALDLLSKIEGVSRVAPQLYVGEYEKGKGSYSIFAIDVERDFTVSRWFDGDLKEVLRSGYAVVGYDVPLDDDVIDFKGNTIKVYGRLVRSGTGLDQSIIISFEKAYSLRLEGSLRHYSEGQATSFLIALERGYSQEEVAEKVKAAIGGISVVTASKVVSVIKDSISGVLLYLSLITASVLIMSAVLTSAVLSMVVNERRAEIGVLRALGMKGREVLLSVVLEALLIALSASAIGSLIGTLLIQVTWPSTSLLVGIHAPAPRAIDYFVLARSVLITTSSAVAAATYPAFLAMKVDPYAAIRES